MEELRQFVIKIKFYSSDLPSFFYIDNKGDPESEAEARKQFNEAVSASIRDGLECASLWVFGYDLLNRRLIIDLEEEQIIDIWIEELILEVG